MLLNLSRNIKRRITYLCPYKTGISEVVFIYCKSEYANTTSVSNMHITRLLWVRYGHAQRV